MRVDILGAGSVGLAIAGRLAAQPGLSVRLRTRSAEQADRLSALGFTLLEPTGEAKQIRLSATAGGATEPVADVLLVAVKCPATAAAARQHSEAVGPATLVATLQNGLGAERILSAALTTPVAVGVTRLGAHRTADGVRLVAAGRTLLGPIPVEPATPALAEKRQQVRERLIVALNAAGLPTESADPIEPHVWRKLIINAAINAVAGLGNLLNGQLAERPDAVAVMAEVVAEGLSVADAVGVRGLWPSSEAGLTEVLSVARATGGNVCSLLADRRAGRAGCETEIDFINGAVVAAAEGVGLGERVATNRLLWRLVRSAGPLTG